MSSTSPKVKPGQICWLITDFELVDPLFQTITLKEKEEVLTLEILEKTFDGDNDLPRCVSISRYVEDVSIDIDLEILHRKLQSIAADESINYLTSVSIPTWNKEKNRLFAERDRLLASFYDSDKKQLESLTKVVKECLLMIDLFANKQFDTINSFIITDQPGQTFQIQYWQKRLEDALQKLHIFFLDVEQRFPM
jgi:hypothetical protein